MLQYKYKLDDILIYRWARNIVWAVNMDPQNCKHANK